MTAIPLQDGMGIGTFALFTYDFPHRKSDWFIRRLFCLGLAPEIIIAAPSVPVAKDFDRPRTTIHDFDIPHPRDLAGSLNLDYISMPHAGRDIESLLDDLHPSIGLIAGSRILSASVIHRFEEGIVNIHPSILPGTRGLDAWLWDLQEGRQLGVTAHLVDSRVDCGRKLTHVEVAPDADETLPEIWLRLLSAQVSILGDAIEIARTVESTNLPELGPGSALRGPMPPNLIRSLAHQRAGASHG